MKLTDAQSEKLEWLHKQAEAGTWTNTGGWWLVATTCRKDAGRLG